MKKAFVYIRRLFKKRRTFSSIFSEAIAEGIRDTMKEMEYNFQNDDKNEDVFQNEKQEVKNNPQQ